MNNRYLFKAKSIETGEWVEGYLYIRKDGVAEISYYNKEWDVERYTHEVDAKTICQFTGLTDKNGQKIWENDIVAHKYTKYTEEPNEYPPFGAEEKTKNYVVKWDNTGVYLGYRYHNGRNIFPFKRGSVLNGNDEVIGNVFDNAELLKE